MSWGATPHDDYEESFWPSFTDIMMVIVMVFLLVTLTVVISNTRLVTQLRSSIQAEQQASQLAERQLQANASLEDQLEFYKNRAAAVEMELLRSRAQIETLNTQLSTVQQDLTRTQTAQATQQAQAQAQLNAATERTQQLETDLASAQTARQTLQTELDNRQARTTELEQQVQRLTGETETLKASSTAALSKLQGELDDLDKKYQKLLRPERSPKGKQVVEVVYQKNSYRIRKPSEFVQRNVDIGTLNSELAALKAQYGTDLYVKIIIPDNSGLSYSEAWRFTRDMLDRYDYYYQGATPKPANPESTQPSAQ